MSDDELKTIEEWKAIKQTSEVAFNIARAITPGWGVGKLVDEATYDAAILAGSTLQILPL